MILIDVNILIYAFDKNHTENPQYHEWIENTINNPSIFGISELVLSSFIRIVTNHRVFKKPATIEEARNFVDKLIQASNCCIIRPGDKNWDIFIDLCRKSNAKGNLVADAYHAALAVESGCELITTDRDFARFPDLKWRHPFE